jgi:hypothetical protein
MTDDMGFDLKLPAVGELTFPQWQDWLVRYNAVLGERDARIEKLEAEVESLKNIRHYGLRHIMRVQEGELPKDEVYGLPLFAEKNKVYPWPAETVELYAYWKRTDK